MNGQVIVSDWQDNLLPDRAGGARDGGSAPRSASMGNTGFGNGIDISLLPTPATGVQYSEALALTSATAYACSRARAETLASLPSIVYQQVSETIRRRARGTDPWHLLYDDPNPFMDSTCFYELMNTRQVNRGNGFAEIERDNADNPIYLWPIHPSRVLARTEFDGSRWRLYWDVMTDVRDPSESSYVMHRVEDRNMLNVCNFGGNGVIAPGVIDMQRDEISLDLTTRQYGATFFKNGGKPTAVIEYPSYIDDDDQRREFRADMNSVLKGSENWHGVPIMWNNAKYKEIQVDPERAQFLETRQFSARQLCRVWNVPPAIVQIFDDYKFNTVDAMIMQFVLTAVRPDAVRMERAISRKVLSYRDERGRLQSAFNGEYFLEFLLEGLLRGDTKKQAETMEIKRRNGIVNANQWRAMDNENPIGEQGDLYIVPGGFTTLEQLKDAPPPGAKAASGNGGSDNASASGQQLPEFIGRERLIETVDRVIGPRRNIVRGASVRRSSARSRERRLIKSMALNQLTEAVERINATLETERSRLANKGQALGQIHYDRYRARMEDALLPGCQSYATGTQIQSRIMASSLAGKLVNAQQRDGAEVPLKKLAAQAAKAKGIVNE